MSKNNRWLRQAALLVLAFGVHSLAAADAPAEVRFGGPILGFVFDSAVSGVRPISGVAGAASLDEKLDLGIQMARAAVSSQRRYVLADAAGATGVLLIPLAGASASGELIPGARAGAEKMVLSPSGDSAAFYYPEGHAVQLLTGLPESPRLGASLDTSSLPGPVMALAVSDGAGAVLAVVAENETGSIYLLSASAEARFIAAGSVVTFLGRRNDALLADGLRNQVSLIRNVTGSPEVSVIAAGPEGISNPVAVEVSLDSRTAVIANGDSGMVTTVDLQSRASSTVSCGCRPTGLYRLKGNAVFRLTEPSDEPVLVFDSDGVQARVVFLPLSRNTGLDAAGALFAPQSRN